MSARETEAGLAEVRRTASKRALAISDELRKSARTIRQTSSKSLTEWTRIGSAALNYRQFSAIRRRWPWVVGLICGYILPALLVVGYFGIGMSNQYISEARFAVRGGEQVSADLVSSLTGLSSFTQAQDSLIVVNFVKSQAIVDQLEHAIGLRALFSRRDIDWLSRFNDKNSIEKLVKYWRWKISTDIESPSGIITVRVSAFSPADAQKITNAVVSLSEQLINTMSNRARRDAVEEAESELARAEQRLGKARVALRDLRNAQSTLDPRRTAEGINKLIGELRLERARLEEEVNSAKRSQITESAPQVQVLRTRIQAVADQIVDLERQMTSATGDSVGTVSSKITPFDELELERQIAEKQYTLAVAAFERARINAERQKMYLTTFVAPLLPEESEWPKRFWLSLAGFLGTTVLYWIGALAATMLINRRTG
jgi:capsular polysaccharide transport system permease protein